MARALGPADRRIAAEAVRRGLLPQATMEEAVRAWEAATDGEAFAVALVRQGALTAAQIEALAAAAAPAAASAADLDEDNARPPEIQGYRILDRLGRGGMGSVYRAVQAGLDREVALKVLRRPLAQDQQQVERLRREARLIGALDHPNIVRGLDTGQSGIWHYFAMEFVEGETLRDRLVRGAIPEAESLRIVEQLALALDHAHSRGVVHRDVKPGNVILAPDGNAKLTDFGLAKGPADFALTQSGVTIGTPQYISPEQARDPTRVDVQTDLYSLGATAYHMLTGVPPHTSETLAGLVTKVLYEKPRTTKQVNPRVSEGASFLVEKLMAKQKRHRYATPRDVLRDLRALAQGRSIVPTDWAGDFEVHAERRRSRRIAAWAGASVVALAAGAGWLQWRAEKDRIALRETIARTELQDVERFPRARRTEWERYETRLREFREAYAGTEAAARAETLVRNAAEHVRWWKEAERHRGQARETAEARRFNAAMRDIDDRIREMERAPVALTDVIAEMADVRGEIRAKGIEAANEEVERLLEQSAARTRVDGAAAVIAQRMRELARRIRDDYVENDGAWPLQRLVAELQALTEAQALVEDSYLGSWRADEARLLGENRFVELAAGLDAAAAKVAADPRLASLLSSIPSAAAEDLRTRIAREREKVERANDAFVAAALASAKAKEAAGDLDGALAVVEAAATSSIGAARETARDAVRGLEQKRADARLAVARRLEAFWVVFHADIQRRDFPSARSRIESIEAVPAGSTDAADVRAAATSARLLVSRLERVLERVLARIEAKRPFEDGLQFDEGDRIRWPRVSNVRVRRTDLEWVITFDSPGQAGLQGSLHRLSLPMLLRYADLAAPGLGNEDALARAILVVADGAAQSLEEIRAAGALLSQVRGRIPGVEPAVDAFLSRVDVLEAEKLEAAQNREQTARSCLEAAQEAIRNRVPTDALRNLQMLTTSLADTRFAKENASLIEGLRAQAERQKRELGWLGMWPGAVVSEKPLFTSALWTLDGEDQLPGFLAPEDNGVRLYTIERLPAGPGAPPEEGPREGRLAFVAPAPGATRGLRDSPLELECPFTVSRRIAVAFTYGSPGPFYLQVSIAGNHVGVLTDDGRRTSGRGVFAWQALDWRNPDERFPDEHRHGEITPRLLSTPVKGGDRYFQFEANRAYRVRVELDRGTLRLHVDDKPVWEKSFDQTYYKDSPPRIRIVTYTPGWIDDLSVEGVPDPSYRRK